MKKHGFTLVEMLFVVIIAATALAFGAYKIRDVKNTGIEKGATGFLMDLANAKWALEKDLALQGVTPNKIADMGLTENIKITTAGAAFELTGADGSTDNEATGKTLSEYLNPYLGSAGTPLAEALTKALFGFKYIERNVDTIGGYEYYLYAGVPIVARECGSLPEEMDKEHLVAYMCIPSNSGGSPKYESTKNSPRCKSPSGWAYLDDGTIRARDGGKPQVVGANPCDDLAHFTCNQKTVTRTRSAQTSSSFNGKMSCAALREAGEDGTAGNGDVVGTPSYSGSCSLCHKENQALCGSCTTTCTFDITEKNNNQSDDSGENTTVKVLINGMAQDISCYAYWHYYSDAA